MTDRGRRPLLVLVTDSYPWQVGGESTFLEPEVPHLLARFEVVIVPMRSGGRVAATAPGVTVCEPATSVSVRRRAVAGLLALAHPDVWREIINREIPMKIRAVARLVRHAVRAQLLHASMRRVMHGRSADAPVVVYSYWFGPGATAGHRLRQRFPHQIRAVVTRAHGYDLFHEENEGGYIPLRTTMISNVDAVLSVSEAGAVYLKARFPFMRDRIGHAPIGTVDPGFVVVPSTTGLRRVVSCAACVPVKRIETIVDVLAATARLRPSLPIRWTHLGGGPELASIARRAESLLGGRVDVDLRGQVAGPDVLAEYRDRGADALLSVSRSEGRPVSMMEAQSVGIPVVATDVGGVRELVDHEVGALVSRDASVERIAAALVDILDAPLDLRRERHRASRARWEMTSDAEVVHREFAERLVDMSRCR